MPFSISHHIMVIGKYDRETKAQALALIELGSSAAQAARELGLKKRIVQLWAQQLREIAPEEEDARLLNEHYRLAAHAFALTHDALDELEEEPAKRKYLVPLNIVGNTHVDKIIKHKELRNRGSGPNITGPIVIVYNAQKPEIDVIKGEVVEREG